MKFGQFPADPGPHVPQPTQVWEIRYRSDEPLLPHGSAASNSAAGNGWTNFVQSLDAVQRTWVVASVHRGRELELARWVKEHRPRDGYQLLSYRDIPLVLDVRFPERVGLDRLATSVVANHLRVDGRPAIVVDAGTALKVHAVSAQGAFMGGAIFPGYRLAGRALAVQTDLLPEVGVSSQDHAPPAIGRDTESAIRSGLFWGFAGAAREIVARLSDELKQQPLIFVTGGDARGLVLSLGPQARFVPDMCLSGIAMIARSLSTAATTSGHETLP
jgi:type III pantothenate kinase